MRDRQVPWWATWALACLLVLGFIGAVFYFQTEPLQTALINSLIFATGFYFGSSSDSSKKTDLLAASPPVVQEEHAEALSAAEALRDKLGAAL